MTKNDKGNKVIDWITTSKRQSVNYNSCCLGPDRQATETSQKVKGKSWLRKSNTYKEYDARKSNSNEKGCLLRHLILVPSTVTLSSPYHCQEIGKAKQTFVNTTAAAIFFFRSWKSSFSLAFKRYSRWWTFSTSICKQIKKTTSSN